MKANQPVQEDILVGKRVVAVEDEGITLMQLERIFRSAGMHLVGTATSGPAGVALTLKECPDLVLMDINMPGDYNGIEAARRILAETNACVIMLTAYADYLEQAKTVGACGYVIKPLDRDTLLVQMRRAFTRFVAGEPPLFAWV